MVVLNNNSLVDYVVVVECNANKMHIAKTMQLQLKCNDTNQEFVINSCANVMQIQCKYNANTMQVQCKCNANSMQNRVQIKLKSNACRDIESIYE